MIEDFSSIRPISDAIMPGSDSDHGMLCCPLCDTSYVHVQAVAVNAGGKKTLVDHEGTHENSGEAEGRGAVIRLSHWCEMGHAFTVRLSFHKGVTFVAYEDVREQSTETIHLPDLWRD